MAQTYVTQGGDTLWALAERFYGDGNRWTALYEANSTAIGPDPNQLTAGKILIIPDLPPGPPPGPAQTHLTTPSDTLWDLAARFYGDGAQWPKIYEANKALIGPDPNRLTAGLTLIIPG
jgi:nucleoid-associated protein YgaU